VHVLHELLRLVPTLSVPTALPMVLDVLGLVGDVVESIAHEHEHGPHALRADSRSVPRHMICANDGEVPPTPAQAEDQARVRVMSLLQWLRAYRVIVEDTPDDTPADTDDVLWTEAMDSPTQAPMPEPMPE
jgi:hypothetical protein